MTDPSALATRAVTCKGWRWVSGMLTEAGFRMTDSLVPFAFAVDRPVLDDPATVGCLLALVRTAYRDPGIHVRWYAQRWWMYDSVGADWTMGSTEAEALVAALESAP